jgi:hypothetical protein
MWPQKGQAKRHSQWQKRKHGPLVGPSKSFVVYLENNISNEKVAGAFFFIWYGHLWLIDKSQKYYIIRLSSVLGWIGKLISKNVN